MVLLKELALIICIHFSGGGQVGLGMNASCLFRKQKGLYDEVRWRMALSSRLSARLILHKTVTWHAQSDDTFVISDILPSLGHYFSQTKAPNEGTG